MNDAKKAVPTEEAEVEKSTAEKPTQKTKKSEAKPNKKVRGLNNGTFSGIIEKSELKKSGSFELYVNTDQTRRDTPIKGSVIPAHFTSTIFARVSKPIVERVGKDAFSEGCHIIIPYMLVGIRRVVDGKPYDIVEVRAKDAIPTDTLSKTG